ncbi:MAG: hypothetical protein K1X28_01130 [Parachlamydiales bacterium]|nr:hypothetical protein [Parachlamydiales bacterium]
MRIEISRREVLNNLIRFKDSLLDGTSRKNTSAERIYKVLLNRKTGDMRFPQKIKSLEYHIARKKGKGEAAADWKEARIIVDRKDPEAPAHFEICDSKNQRLEPTDMEPLAWRVVRETLEVLNVRAKQVVGYEYGMLPEEAVLNDLSSIHLSIPIEQIEDLPAWMGALPREDAERRLEGQPEGTYLLREGDDLTQAIGFHFSEENHLSVHPFVLTVVEEEEKISDILLIKTAKGWTLYHDDPNLNDTILYKYESTPQSLLRQLEPIAKKPVSRET